MTQVFVRHFEAQDLEPLVALLNAAISGRRHTGRIEVQEFSRRVLQHPGFDPSGLLLACARDGRVAGFIHAVLPPEGIPLYRSLAGRGYLLGPWVQPDMRGRGIGRQLLAEAEHHLAPHCETLLAHGLRAPFYSAREGPRQPYCGSSELLGLTVTDQELLGLYRAAGYHPVAEQEVSLLAALPQALDLPAAPGGVEIVRVNPGQPWQGRVAWMPPDQAGYGYEQYEPMAAYDTLAVVQDGVVAGHCQWYAMRVTGRAALYDLRLEEGLRGRGLGRWLFEAGLAAMIESGFREVELHTSPQRNALAYSMYLRRGMKQAASWVILRKDV